MSKFCGSLLLLALITFQSCIASQEVVARKLKFSPRARPPPSHHAEMARYLAHTVDWCVIGTTSTMKGREGLPFTNIISMSDGPVNNSTGVPYFYVMDLDQSNKDILENNRVSISMSEYQTGYCSEQGFDAENPNCTRLTLGGKFVKVTDKAEKDFALKALFTRHTEMKSWPDHGYYPFYPAKMDIDFIWLLDAQGPAAIISPKDYYAV